VSHGADGAAHNRLELAAIDTVDRVLRANAEVAVFDTAFHSTLRGPYVQCGTLRVAQPGDPAYGFHGISHPPPPQAAELLGSKPRGSSPAT
jgi:acetate kinase